MSYLDLAKQLIKGFEGCRLIGYGDTGGVPTNGWGHTGPEVLIGAPITQEIAEHNLDVDVATADRRVQDVCGAGWAALDDHEKAALVDFTFNLGAKPSWTIWADVRGGKLDAVPDQIMRFDHGVVNGRLQEIPGLEHRRAAEVVFWRTADAAQAIAVVTSAPVPQVSSGYVRDLETPPAPLPAPPLAKTSLVTKCVTAVAGGCAALGTTASQVHDIVAPHVDEGHVFKMLAVGASGVVVAAAIVGLFIHGEQAHLRTQ